MYSFIAYPSDQQASTHKKYIRILKIYIFIILNIYTA